MEASEKIPTTVEHTKVVEQIVRLTDRLGELRRHL
jgi:hypothetical protein